MFLGGERGVARRSQKTVSGDLKERKCGVPGVRGGRRKLTGKLMAGGGNDQHSFCGRGEYAVDAGAT